MRRGVSLVELLITLGLLALVAGVVAGLAREYARLLGSRTQDHSLFQAHAALDAIARELAGAIRVASPARGGPAVDSLDFERLSADPGRFLPATPWQPWPASATLRVRYELEDETLWHILTRPGQGPQRRACGYGLQGLAARWPNGGPLEVTLSVQRGERLRTLTARVNRWLP